MTKEQYTHALLREEYAVSTSIAYPNALTKIEKLLDVKIYHAPKNSLEALIADLDIDGDNEELGARGHRTYINALKRYYIMSHNVSEAPVEIKRPEPKPVAVKNTAPYDLNKDSTDRWNSAAGSFTEKILSKYIGKMERDHRFDFQATMGSSKVFDYSSFENFLTTKCKNGGTRRYGHMLDTHRLFHAARNAAGKPGVEGKDRMRRAIIIENAIELTKYINI